MSTKKQGIAVLVTGSIMQLFLGIIYVWSVFVKPVGDHFNWYKILADGTLDYGDVKLTSSFMLCFFVFGIIAGGKLHLKLGCEKVVLGGGLMVALGMLATAFLPENLVWMMYITYGVIGGFGVGAAYNVIICAAQKWYPQKRGLATGIVVSAFGFSTVVFAPLVEFLVKQFELQYTFLILAAAFSVATIALFKFIRLPDESKPASAPAAAMLIKRQYTLTETIKTKEFYIIALSLMTATATFFILNPSFKTYAEERGVEAFGTYLVMLTGVASALGRLIVPAVSDKIGRERATLSVLGLTSLCALSLFIPHGIIFIIAVLLTAFCFGALPGLYSVLAVDYFGIKNAGANYGAIMMGFAVSTLAFPWIIGMISDDRLKFITLACVSAVGVLLVVALLLIKKKSRE